MTRSSFVPPADRWRTPSFTRRPYQRLPRAVLKPLGYRVLMVCITAAVALAVVDELGAAPSIGVATNLVETGTHFCDERAWHRVEWGV